MFSALQQTLRSLRRAPTFSVTVVLILAVGIGVSTAVFSVLHAVVLRPLPYAQPQELARIWATMPQRDNATAAVSWMRYQFLTAARPDVLRQTAVTSFGNYTVTGRAEPEQVAALKISGPFFEILGKKPLLGRSFSAEEDQSGGPNVVMLSEQYWRRALEGSPAVLGTTIVLDGQPHTIVGVTPATFTTPYDAPDVWVPRAFESAGLPASSVARGAGFLYVLARLQPGVQPQQVQAVLDLVAKNYAAAHAGFMDETFGLRAISFQEEISGASRRPLLLLFGAVGIVLLIACANVANLCLTRSLGMRRAIAIRTALGASRGQVLRHFMAEGLLLAFTGAGLGCLLTVWTMPLLTQLAANYLPRWSEVAINLPVLGFATGAALLCGALFGFVPLLQLSSVDCQEALRDGSRGTTNSPANLRFRQFLLAAEVALALMLTVGAGLLVVSFGKVQRVDPGFRVEGLYRASFPLAGAQYADALARGQFADRVLALVRQAPGVESAAFVLGAPYTNESSLFTAVLPGRPANDPKERHIVRYGIATPGYFSVIGTPLVEGRELTEADNLDGRKVVVINETMAHNLFPEGRALDREFIRPFDKSTWRIVGIVRDIRSASLIDPPQPEAFFPHYGNPYSQLSIVVRTKGDIGLAAQAVRRAVQKIAPQLPMVGAQPIANLVNDSLTQRRLALVLLLIFAGTATLLAAAGIGALSAYTVNQRRYEIGVRMALGATANDVVRQVTAQSLSPVVVGLAVGLVGSIDLSRLIASQLFATAPSDPIVLAATTLLLGVIALLACWLPARRAAKTDPLIALRAE